MPKSTPDAPTHRDIELAKTVLQADGKKTDIRRLRHDHAMDREILAGSRFLTESDRQEIASAIRSISKKQRMALEKYLPPGLLDKMLAETDFSRILTTINACLAENPSLAENGTLEDITRLKRDIARRLRPLLKLQVDHDVNAIIDGNANDSLEEIIEKVLSYVKHRTLGKNVKNISFYLVNEENQYEQIDSLTKVTPGIISAPVTRQDFNRGREHLPMLGEKDHVHGNRIIPDYPNNRLFIELNIKGLDLGVLQIDLKPGKKLSEIEMECLWQAASRLDSKIDEAMRTKRLALIAENAHRILDEHGTENDFEAGIAEFMVYLCRYSTAYEAEVLVDIYGDGEDFFAKNFNDDGEINPVDIDESTKTEIKIPSATRQVDHRKVLITDIVDAAKEGPEQVIGKVYFRTNMEVHELRNEDRTLLHFCAKILHSHILAWRKHLKLRIEGVDPQIARTTMRGGVKDTVKEIITALYTDISGYTYICELVEDALSDFPEAMEDVETFKAILTEFLNLVQISGQTYGGIWDKAVGDMGLMEFGVPIDVNGRDPLGDVEQNRHPEYFAFNALKTSLLIRHKLTTVTAKFREHLLKLACRKYPCGNRIPETLPREEQENLLERLKDETGLTPKIAITTSVYTGPSGYVKLPLGAASDWTAIGDTMNSAARVQSSSGKMEIRVPLLTRDLVFPLIKTDRMIPLNGKGDTEKWSEFVLEKLGLDPARTVVDFVESYEGHKNRTGRNAVFTLIVKEKNPEIDSIQHKSAVPASQLLKYEGEEFGIENRLAAAGNEQLFFLTAARCAPAKNIRFQAAIPREAIEERVVKYASPKTLAIRHQNGTLNTLNVQDGRFRETVWKSIEEDQDEQLASLAENMRKSKEMVVIYNRLIPSGCYVLASQEPCKDDGYDIITIEKNNFTFKVRVSKSRIHEGPGPILKDLTVLYDFQSYYDTIKGQTSPDKPVMFVHKRHFYKVTPAEADKFIMPIKTRPSLNPRGHETQPTSNPPPSINFSRYPGS